MRLGLNVGYWGRGGLTAAEQVRLAREAEALGFDSVWASEAYGSDAATVLAFLAARTERIRLGSALFQMPARSPAMTAMTIATLDGLSGGRVALGLGSSGPQVAEGWHGQRFDGQLQRTREYVSIVRRVLAGERLQHDGEAYRLPLPDGPGVALKLTIAPVQQRVPIYLGAIGPRNTELAGEIADGWMPIFFSPEHAPRFHSALERGAERAGRQLDERFDIAPSALLCIDADHDRARDELRPALALYVGGMGSRRRNFYKELMGRYGFADAAEQVQELYLAGEREQAAAALPAELIDATTLSGPPRHVADRLEAYRGAGVGTLIVTPIGRGVDDRVRMMRELSEHS